MFSVTSEVGEGFLFHTLNEYGYFSDMCTVNDLIPFFLSSPPSPCVCYFYIATDLFYFLIVLFYLYLPFLNSWVQQKRHSKTLFWLLTANFTFRIPSFLLFLPHSISIIVFHNLNKSRSFLRSHWELSAFFSFVGINDQTDFFPKFPMISVYNCICLHLLHVLNFKIPDIS